MGSQGYLVQPLSVLEAGKYIKNTMRFLMCFEHLSFGQPSRQQKWTFGVDEKRAFPKHRVSCSREAINMFQKRAVRMDTLVGPPCLATGPNSNSIVLRRRKYMFCRKMSFGVGERAPHRPQPQPTATAAATATATGTATAVQPERQP